MEDNQVTYHIQILDNGIMFRDIENELFECKEFSGNGGEKDEAINKYIGLNLWSDLLNYCDNNLTNKVKVNITFEKED